METIRLIGGSCIFLFMLFALFLFLLPYFKPGGIKLPGLEIRPAKIVSHITEEERPDGTIVQRRVPVNNKPPVLFIVAIVVVMIGLGFRLVYMLL